MEINLDSKKTLKYRLSDLDKVSKINLIISFNNNVEYKFDSVINVEDNEITVELPVLNSMIRDEVTASCYLEIFRITGEYYRVGRDTVQFIHEEEIPINTEFGKKDEIETELIENNVVTAEIHMKNVLVKKKKVKRTGVKT